MIFITHEAYLQGQSIPKRFCFLQRPTHHFRKRPLTHQDYDAWKSIQSSQLSRDGKWVAYALVPQDGDGEIIVRNIASGAEWKHNRGYRPPPPPADASEAGPPVVSGQANRAIRPFITADSKFVIFTIPSCPKISLRTSAFSAFAFDIIPSVISFEASEHFLI